MATQDARGDYRHVSVVTQQLSVLALTHVINSGVTRTYFGLFVDLFLEFLYAGGLVPFVLKQNICKLEIGQLYSTYTNNYNSSIYQFTQSLPLHKLFQSSSPS